MVISIYGTKKAKMNVRNTGHLSANLGSVSSHKGLKTGIEHGVSEGEIVKVPTLDTSRWVYELEVVKTAMCGESDTFFCEIKNV